MKKKDLEKKLSRLGWYFKRHGGAHDIWTNGQYSLSVPRHPEIVECIAKKVIRTAKENPPKGN